MHQENVLLTEGGQAMEEAREVVTVPNWTDLIQEDFGQRSLERAVWL